MEYTLTGSFALAKDGQKLSDGAIAAIEGLASTPGLNSYGFKIRPSAYQETMSKFMEHPLVFFMHEIYDQPVGKVVAYEITDKGLWVRIEIADTSTGRDITRLVEFNILNSLSVGIDIEEWFEPADKNEPREATKVWPREISIVNLGADKDALFKKALNLGINLNYNNLNQADDGGGPKRKDRTMLTQEELASIKQCETMVGDLGSKVTSLATAHEEMQRKYDEAMRLTRQLQDVAERAKTGLITQDEYKLFVERIGMDILTLQNQLAEMKQAQRIVSARLPYKDWRSYGLAKGIIFETDDEGHALPEIEQRAYHLLRAPMDYTNGDGELVKLLRDVNDAVVLSKAFMSKKEGFKLQNLKSYKVMLDLMGIVDPQFKLAMYSTGTGVGDEWVPTFMSSEIHDLYGLKAVLEGYIPHFDMPSNPYEWRILNSKPQLYRAAEATSNTPSLLTASNAGTAKITFNAETFAVRVPVSKQDIEDSIIAMISEMRNIMADASADGYESLLINGDTTATHMDTGHAYTSLNPETYEKGFRKIASDLSATFTVASTSAGVGDATAAFAAADVWYLRKLAKDMGTNPAEWVNVVSPAGYFQIMIMTQLSTPGSYGVGAGQTYVTGSLEKFAGAPLVVSAQISDLLNASGIYDASTMTKTVIFGFNRTQFKIGQRRGFTVEVESSATAQQLNLVTTFRKSFQKMSPSTKIPVALGYAVPN